MRRCSSVPAALSRCAARRPERRGLAGLFLACALLAGLLLDVHFAAGRAFAAQAAGSLALPRVLWQDGRSLSGELKSRVSMRAVKHARVLGERALDLPPAAATWSGTGVRVMELLGAGPGLDGFNEARLDYVGQDPERAGLLGFVLGLERAGESALFVSDPLETVDRLTPAWADGPGRDAVPVARADWVAKGLRYQLSRLLDRAPDDLWRISQDGLSTFLQRRFAKSLVDVGAVDVVLRRGQDVQVNLVVSLEGRGKTVLDWYALPKRTFDLGDGRSVLRLYVGRHLRSLAPGARSVTLKEAALMFFKENKEDVARDRGVERIVFVPSGLPGELQEKGLPRDLPARAREVFAGRGELAANLESLGDPAWKEYRLAWLAVAQSPQDPDAPFDQSVEGARLAKVAPRRDVPALTAATEDLCRSFGASCDPDAPGGFVSQEPVRGIDFSALAARPGREPRGLHLVGEGLFSAPGRLSFGSALDGLTVACSGAGAGGPSITLETGAAFIPEPGKRYGVWLELGRTRDGLAGVEAEAYGGGESARVRVKPGLAAWFPSLPGRVEGVRLHFSSHSQELAVTLRKAVVQASDPAAPRRDLFEARFLFDATSPLEISRTGQASASLAPSGTPFPAQWLVVDVVTTAWTVEDEKPVLTLDAGGSPISVRLPARQARLALRLPDAPVGRDWPGLSLSLSGGAPGASLEVSDALLAGQRLASWPEILGGIDLADLSGRPAFLEGLDAGKATRMATGAWWMPMGRVDAPAGEAGVRFPANPWLEVDALLVADASGPDMAVLGRAGPDRDQDGDQARGPDLGADRKATGSRASWPGKLAVPAGLILLGLATWLAWRNGRGARAWNGFIRWLASGAALGFRAWLAALAALAVGALLVGPGSGRALGVLATLATVPLWRACRQGMSRFLPVLAKSAPVHYCTGFLGAAALAALVRLAGAAPVAEYLGLAGLWLFFAALVTGLGSRQGSSDSAGSAQ